jgi:UDP-glucose 4-epimerase
MSPTLLVTWGLWYIGSHTVVEFLSAWYEIVILDNLSNSSETVWDRLREITWKSPIIYQWDIRDTVLLETIFSHHTIEWVLHFAGKKAVWESCDDPWTYYSNNITGSINLFETMLKYDVRNIIFSSSATVYNAEIASAPYNEWSTLGTKNPYGTTKRVIEEVLYDLAIHKWLHAICLRYFNPIGAHVSGKIGENPLGKPNNLVPYILKVCSGELPEAIVYWDDYDTKDGTWIRDYIHVMDLAVWHLVAYCNIHTIQYEVVNLGSWIWTSVLEIISYVAKTTDKIIPYTITSRRPWDVAISIADPSKAEKLWWWKTKYSITEWLRDSRNFIAQNYMH